MKPKFTVDLECEAAYLKITKKRVNQTDPIGNGIIIDYDKHGYVVGIEFLNLDILRQIQELKLPEVLRVDH